MGNIFFYGNEVVTVKRKSKIIYTILGVVLMCVFLTIMFIPIMDGKQRNVGSIIFLELLGLGGVLFFISMILSLLKGKTEIQRDRIIEIGLIKEIIILYSDVKGYRINQKDGNRELVIYSNDGRKVGIGMNICEIKIETMEWIEKSFKNLDEADKLVELDEMTANEEFGLTKEERIKKLALAKKVSKIINIAVAILSIVVLIFPYYYRAAIWLMLSIPILSSFLIKYFNGLIKFDGDSKKLYPNIALAFFFPGSVLSLRALLDWNIFAWNYFWNPFIVISASLFILIMLSGKGINKKVSLIVGVLFVSFIYGFGATISLNGVYSSPEKKVFYSHILDKRIDKGKHTSYYFKLAPWEMKTKEAEERVEKDVYGIHSVGDKVKIVVRTGLFKIIWTYVE